MRRTLTAWKILAVVCMAWLTGLGARADTAVMEDEKYRRAFDEAVDKGLAFLARSQAADGSIGGPATPAITSLAVMAFLARGYSPGLPPYGDTINRGIDHILSIAPPSGLLMGQNGQMYSHNIAALMLSEVSGMVDPGRQARIDEVLPRALRIILAAQDVAKGEGHAGGWRYAPTSGDSDISGAGWALCALRSARNNGAPVPKDVDGISIVPELFRKQQPQHRYLYWEIANQTAVRMGDWKAYRKGNENAAWQLYDLSKDISETTDVAAQHTDVLARMKAFAAEAHRPMPQGEIYDRSLVEKDRNYLDKPIISKPKKKKKGNQT